MVKVVLTYTVFREVLLDQVDSTEIEQIQQEDQEKFEAAGFGVEDPSWELDEDQESVSPIVEKDS